MISVCLATYNGAKYLLQQLDSILPQLSTQDELLISDDGSTDETLSIIEGCRNTNVVIFKNNFENPVKNFEFLFNQAQGNIIVPCDQDDVWLPNKLKIVRAHLEGKVLAAILMNADLIDGQGKNLNKTTFQKWGTRLGFTKNLMRNTYMGSSMAFTADISNIALPFPEKIAMHDWYLGLLIERIGHLKMDAQIAMQYRLHSNNASLQGSTFSEKIKWRINMQRTVAKRVKKYLKTKNGG